MVDNRRMANAKRVTRAGTLTAADWIAAASLAIAEGGVDAVAVEPLAQRLGVTKGSFYWHFPNRDALLKAAVERWAEEGTEAVIAVLDGISDPRRRLEQLVARAFADRSRTDGVAAAGAASDHAFDGVAVPGIGSSHAFDLAIADAADDPVVGPILRRVSERRVDYLDECFRALGYPPEGARYRALLAYAAYVGTLRLAREAPSRLPRNEEYRAYQQHVIATIMPATGSNGEDQPSPSAPAAHD
jgi:AcrR family transcriptional regulator